MNRSIKIFLGICVMAISGELNAMSSLVGLAKSAKGFAKKAKDAALSQATSSLKRSTGELSPREQAEYKTAYSIFEEFTPGMPEGAINKIIELIKADKGYFDNEGPLKQLRGSLITNDLDGAFLIQSLSGVNAAAIKDDFIKSMVNSAVQNKTNLNLEKWILDLFDLYYNRKAIKAQKQIEPYLAEGYALGIEKQLVYKTLGNLQKLLSIMAKKLNENQAFRKDIAGIQRLYQLLDGEEGIKENIKEVLNKSNAVKIKETLKKNDPYINDAKLLENYGNVLNLAKEIIIKYIKAASRGPMKAYVNQPPQGEAEPEAEVNG